MHHDPIIVPLSQGKVALIDAEDAERILAFKWSLSCRGYAFRTRRVAERPGSMAIFMHRAIIDAPDGRHVDHANGDRLDNRRSNLRLATPSQNSANAKRPHDNRSGFKGVTLLRKYGTWQAQIGANGGHFYLGRFASPEEAARAYDAAARYFFGEYARVNFPDE